MNFFHFMFGKYKCLPIFVRNAKTKDMNLDYDYLQTLSIKELDAILETLTNEIKTIKTK